MPDPRGKRSRGFLQATTFTFNPALSQDPQKTANDLPSLITLKTVEAISLGMLGASTAHHEHTIDAHIVEAVIPSLTIVEGQTLSFNHATTIPVSIASPVLSLGSLGYVIHGFEYNTTPIIATKKISSEVADIILNDDDPTQSQDLDPHQIRAWVDDTSKTVAFLIGTWKLPVAPSTVGASANMPNAAAIPPRTTEVSGISKVTTPTTNRQYQGTPVTATKATLVLDKSSHPSALVLDDQTNLLRTDLPQMTGTGSDALSLYSIITDRTASSPPGSTDPRSTATGNDRLSTPTLDSPHNAACGSSNLRVAWHAAALVGMIVLIPLIYSV